MNSEIDIQRLETESYHRRQMAQYVDDSERCGGEAVEAQLCLLVGLIDLFEPAITPVLTGALEGGR